MKIMAMIFYSAIVEAFSIKFSNWMNQTMYPDVWKRSTLCPIHKNCGKQ